MCCDLASYHFELGWRHYRCHSDHHSFPSSTRYSHPSFSLELAWAVTFEIVWRFYLLEKIMSHVTNSTFIPQVIEYPNVWMAWPAKASRRTLQHSARLHASSRVCRSCNFSNASKAARAGTSSHNAHSSPAQPAPSFLRFLEFFPNFNYSV